MAEPWPTSMEKLGADRLREMMADSDFDTLSDSRQAAVLTAIQTGRTIAATDGGEAIAWLHGAYIAWAFYAGTESACIAHGKIRDSDTYCPRTALVMFVTQGVFMSFATLLESETNEQYNAALYCTAYVFAVVFSIITGTLSRPRETEPVLPLRPKRAPQVFALHRIEDPRVAIAATRPMQIEHRKAEVCRAQ
jgi:hypothetical protein